MRYTDLDALVLHVRPYRETSGMVQFFTREHGRIVGVIKGMHRGRNPVVVQPFTLGMLACSGRGGLMTVTRFDAVERLQLHGDALSAGFYVLELLSRSLAERQSEPQVFDASLEVLRGLQTAQSLARALRRFEMVLLAELGYAFDYRHEADTGDPIDPDRHYQCIPQSGFVTADDPRHAIAGTTLLAIDAQIFDDAEVLKAARNLNQLALEPLIGTAPLISRALYTGRPRG